MFLKNCGVICVFIFVRTKTSEPKKLSPAVLSPDDKKNYQDKDKYVFILDKILDTILGDWSDRVVILTNRGET